MISHLITALLIVFGHLVFVVLSMRIASTYKIGILVFQFIMLFFQYLFFQQTAVWVCHYWFFMPLISLTIMGLLCWAFYFYHKDISTFKIGKKPISTKCFVYRYYGLLFISLAGEQLIASSVLTGGLSVSLLAYCGFFIFYGINVFYQDSIAETLGLFGGKSRLDLLSLASMWFPFISLAPGLVLIENNSPSYNFAIVLLLTAIASICVRLEGEMLLMKDEFKSGKLSHVKTCGKDKRVLCAGLWGVGRKLNYTLELIAFWSITFIATSQSWFVLIVPIIISTDLLFRSYFDEKKCQQKYKDSWDEYKKIAKFIMFPYIY